MKSLLKIIKALIVALFVSCSPSDYVGQPQYILYIQDAPADYRSLVSSISGVEIYDGAQWHKLEHEGSSFDLLELTGGEMLKVAWATLNEGNYSQLKITFSSQMRINDGGISSSVEVVSPELIVPINASLATDQQWIDIVDVDVAGSIVETLSAEQTQYSFVPKVSVVDLSVMGVVNLSVVNDEGGSIGTGALVCAQREESSEVYSSYINEVSSMAVLKLPQGFYTLSILLPENSTYYPEVLYNIEVKASQYVNLEPVKLEPKPQVNE